MDGSGFAMAAGRAIATPTTAEPRRNETDALQQALSIAQRLKSLGIAGREFAVTREAGTTRFVIVVRNRETKAVELLRPEDALKLSEQLTAAAASPKAE